MDLNQHNIQRPNYEPSLKPEWIKVTEACRISSIGRTRLYELMNSGEIKSACIRKRGAIKGMRLIQYESLISYLEQLAEPKEDC